ncbi:transposable element Tcb2 transposase [Trichonephila clavipes]|uniref:Transposable element Tcb2 transposase n=1 Tax=Trichonephila clavipes TaxID=2585209 RepID=A0A8X6SC28_TRICX|nr:transposable element Tcb2 transposase [Trichonephila clavipes]
MDKKTSVPRDNCGIVTKLGMKKDIWDPVPITCANLDAPPPFIDATILELSHVLGNWTVAEWNQVVFSDESRFNLRSDDNRVRVWRPRGERLNPAFAFQRHTASTAGVIVWGVIAYKTRSFLELIRGTMTAQRYVHDILQPHVLPLMLPGAILNKTMLGLTRQGCHKTISGRLQLFLSLPDPQVCLQSSISDIIWDGELGILILNKLEASLEQIWNEMSQDII